MSSASCKRDWLTLFPSKPAAVCLIPPSEIYKWTPIRNLHNPIATNLIQFPSLNLLPKLLIKQQYLTMPAIMIPRKSLFARIHGMVSLKKPKKPCFQSSPKPEPVLRVTSTGHELEKVFRYFDEDGDGKISAAELCSCLHSLGEELSPAEAEAVVESSDSDGDGVLGYDDFVKLVDMEEEEEREKTLREAFSAYEMEGRDCITERSLRKKLRLLGEEKSLEECKVMIKRFDINGDGVICFNEFKLMML